MEVPGMEPATSWTVDDIIIIIIIIIIINV